MSKLAIIVQKYGGTSVADAQKIKNVARNVIREKKAGNDVVVIVSAMGHTTDFLLKLANDVSNAPSARELDMLLSTGEQVSIALLAMAIQDAGYNAISLNAMQIGIMTDASHGSARIIDIKTKRLTEELSNGNIIIIAGFQGVCNGEITTLGRGGSDTSAVAIAGALNAQRCDIYTDVEGVYTTDPRIVANASKLDVISYEEMLELARVGANVLHPRAVETAMHANVPLRVRSSFNVQDMGTLILGVKDMEIQKAVTGVATDETQSRIVICDVPDYPGNAAKIFSKLADENISVDMIIQSYARSGNNTNDIAFTVDNNQLAKSLKIVEEIKNELHADKIHVDADIAKVSIVGAGMIDKPGIAATMFNALAKENINIKMISTSEIKISCLVAKDNSKDAVRVLHEVFELGCDKIADVKGDLPNF